MKAILLNALILGTLVLTTSCSDKETHKPLAVSSASQLTESEIEEYGLVINEMFKHSIMTITFTDGACVMETKDLKVDFSQYSDQSIILKQNLSVSATKECGRKKFKPETLVEVLDFDDEDSNCKFSGTKHGDVLEIKSSCDGEISLVDLNAKTLKSVSGKTETFIQATAVDHNDLLGYLANIKIVHYKKNANDSVSISSQEMGDANILLNLGL